MKTAQHEAATSSLGLRLIHLILFLGFTGTTLALIHPELAQLVASQRAEYHFGDPPRALALLAGALLLPGLLVLLVRFVHGRSAPLWASGLVLAAAAVGMTSVSLGELPRGRTWAAADVQILDVAKDLQKRMLDHLQVEGRIPLDEASWRQALEDSSPAPSPARTRRFEQVPYRLVLQREKGRAPERLVPATILAWVSPGGQEFQITPVGFGKDGAVAPLVDEKGEKVVLLGGLASGKAMAQP